MAQHISQREARRLQRRVAELERIREAERKAWGREYPGGVNIETLNLNGVERAALHTAQILGHPLVLVVDSTTTARVCALPAPKQ